MNGMGEHMRSVKDLYQPKPKDSEIVARCKAEMAAIMAGRNTFDYLGSSVPCRTRQKAFEFLGLHARWGK